MHPEFLAQAKSPSVRNNILQSDYIAIESLPLILAAESCRKIPSTTSARLRSSIRTQAKRTRATPIQIIKTTNRMYG